MIRSSPTWLDASVVAGEMVLAAEKAWSAEEMRGDLGELACGTARAPLPSRPTFFRSMELGIEDVKMALEIHRLTLQAGLE
jgi:L-arginine dehydrogenase